MLKNKTVRNVFFTIFCLFACVSFGYAESCTIGAKQYKYMASGCSYTTQTRTCCYGKFWSDWDKSCPNLTCDESKKPAATETCCNEETSKCGSKTRTVSCNNLTLSWTAGSWGSCIIKCEIPETSFYKTCYSNGKKGQVQMKCECDESKGTRKNCVEAGECLIFTSGNGGTDPNKPGGPDIPGVL